MQASLETPSVHALKQYARRAIVNRDISHDQALIIDRWTNTFIYQEGPDANHVLAADMMMFVMALIAKGEFQVSISGEPGSFNQPFAGLTIADYLSHASRVVIDYSKLTDLNKAYFLGKFDVRKLAKRTSSHSFQLLGNGEYKEIKDPIHGATQGVLFPVEAYFGKDGSAVGAFFANLGLEGKFFTDFGINISMGGVNQTNLSGGISAPGKDGHVLLCTPQRDYEGLYDAIMIGLEQTAPFTVNDVTPFLHQTVSKVVDSVVGVGNAVYNFFSSSSPRQDSLSKSPSLEEGDNTTGLAGAHSLIGASDSYTAAGSLYFSNLIYKAKLLTEKGMLTPAKYNGMQVKLTDENLQAVKEFYRRLRENSRKKQAEAVKALLRQAPANTRATEPDVQTLHRNTLFLVKNISVDRDLEEFFQQIDSVYETNERRFMDLFAQKLRGFQAWMKQPRKLLDIKTSLSVFAEGVIDSDNPHVLRLRDIFNDTARILLQTAYKEVLYRLDNPDPVFIQAEFLYTRYKDLADLDQEATFYKSLKKELEELDTMFTKIRTASVSPDESDKHYPLGYLLDLDTKNQSLSKLLASNESRIILKIEQTQATIQLSKLEPTPTPDERAQLIDQLRRLKEEHAKLTMEIQSQHAARLCGLDNTITSQRTQIDELHAALIAEKALFDDEIRKLNAAMVAQKAILEAEIERLSAAPKRVDETLGPVVHPIDHTNAESNWSFIINWMISAAALNIYGALLIMMSALLMTMTALSLVPMVLGGYVAATSVVLGSCCFYKASRKSNIDELDQLSTCKL